jgi:hypothetical protein
MTQQSEYKTELLAACAARKSYEQSKNDANTSIQSTLDSLVKTFDRDAIAAIMCASNVAPDFINKSERTSNRFNVYASEKVANLAQAIAKSATLNHYTLAIVRAAIALKTAETTLNHADAVAACSMSVTHKDKSRAAIIKSARYAKHVAANTASTQSSSSINALQVFNVLTETRDTANHVAYTLNDNDTVTALRELVAQ